MREFSISVEIEAPGERAWEVLRDVERWPEWTETVISVKRLGEGPLGVGQQVEISQPKLRPGVWTITEWEEGKRFNWEMKAPGVRVTARHVVEPRERGCLVRLSVQFSGLWGSLVARMTRELNERYLAIEAAGLKARSEGPA